MYSSEDPSFFNLIRFQYIIGNRSICGKDWKETDCCYDYNKFYFFIGGESSLIIQGIPFSPRSGDLFFIPAGTVHSYSHNPENPAVQYWCHFDMIMADNQKIRHTPDSCLSRPGEKRLTDLFSDLIEAKTEPAPLRSLKEQSGLMRLMAVHLEQIDYSGILHMETDNFKDHLREYINAHFRRSISLDELASTVHLQKNYFIEVFHKNFGTTPVRYINSVRLKEAIRLMHHSSDRKMSIEEIARISGFSDYRYFSRLFKKRYGLTPSAYRNIR